jgi:two-component system response regulator QseB/two-component system response regulator BasR
VPPEPRTLTLLIVEDDPATARLLGTVVQAAGFGPPAMAATAAEALRLAPEAEVILLDNELPDGQGVDLLPGLRGAGHAPSVVLVTAHGGEALAAKALRHGADDYVVKDATLTAVLPQVLERVRRNRALRGALAAAERDLVHAERMAAIGQLNVTLHHTINNPLMAAFAETELLLHDGSLSAEQRTGLDAIRDALGRMRDILQQVATLQHDKTTEYLDGIAMIDLSRRSQPTATHRGEALLLVADQATARVLDMLLRHAGFSVRQMTDAADLHAQARRLGVATVVIAGGTGPGADPLAGFRPAPDKFYTLVALAAGDGAAAQAAGADWVVHLPFDPGTFIGDLLAVMEA